MEMSNHVLETKDLTIKFGGLTAVDHLDLYVSEGEAVGLIGPNGAGKTTAFNMISGLYKPTEGHVIFQGADITGLPAHDVCKKGIGRTFQVVKPFGGMTVLENVMVGGFVHTNKTPVSCKIAEDVLRLVEMDKIANRKAKDLTLPQRKRLEIAKALATKPKLILLDEVLAGLNPTEIEDAIRLVRQINATGVSVLMIEHVLHATMAICSRIYVLDYGKLIATGTPAEVTSNPNVIKAYLGDDYETT